MKPSRSRPICALSIAASDSGGGAGIQADLLTFAAHGVYGATVLVAATAQNTSRISAVAKLPVDFVVAQMDAVFSDLSPRAVKIGALLDGARVRAVAGGLTRWRAKNVVLDPVLTAKTGNGLLAPAAIRNLLEDLLPLCDLVTPNIPEAETLSGARIRNGSDAREAALLLASRGCRAVLVKGGHARGETVTDLLYDGRRFHEIAHPRVQTRATHGTGCTLSAAIAANLALGHGLVGAVRRAIRYIGIAIERGYYPGHGWGVPGRFANRRKSGA